LRQRLLTTNDRVRECFGACVLGWALSLAPRQFRIDEYKLWTNRL
jgi:hypothetical protein